MPARFKFHVDRLAEMTAAVAVASISVFLMSTQVIGAELKTGDVIQDCDVCPKMVLVPAGKFVMGAVKGKKREKPAHEVTIPEPFAISKYEITWDEWKACIADGGCTHEPDDHKWGRGNRPIINIKWEHANNYVKWLTKKTGHTYRLATEAEWEYAARAGTSTNYWWGDKLKKNYANCRKCGTKWSGKKSAPVGSFPPNPWGIHDMHANIWEWTADCWNPNHDGAPDDGSVRSEGECAKRVVRSGSWYYYPKLAHSQSRDKFAADLFSYNIGIRTVRELK